jgi:ABC-type nickel/cobalt efflux system permease component RcnA
MKLEEGIRRHGFRKWYERELLQSHAHLALTLLAMIGVVAAFEAAFTVPNQVERLFDLLAVVVCAVIGLWALRRYLFLLSHAEAMAHQADCPECKAYGRFELARAHPGGRLLTVRCRACQRHWDIQDV